MSMDKIDALLAQSAGAVFVRYFNSDDGEDIRSACNDMGIRDAVLDPALTGISLTLHNNDLPAEQAAEMASAAIAGFVVGASIMDAVRTGGGLADDLANLIATIFAPVGGPTGPTGPTDPGQG